MPDLQNNLGKTLHKASHNKGTGRPMLRQPSHQP